MILIIGAPDARDKSPPSRVAWRAVAGRPVRTCVDCLCVQRQPPLSRGRRGRSPRRYGANSSGVTDATPTKVITVPSGKVTIVLAVPAAVVIVDVATIRLLAADPPGWKVRSPAASKFLPVTVADKAPA